MKIQSSLAKVRNPKVFWTTVKALRQRKKAPCPIKLSALEDFFESIYPVRTVTSPVLESNDPYLDAEISYSEVRSVLNRLRPDKSPGPDGISNPFYQWLPPNWVAFLTSLLNKIFEDGTVPDSWCISDLFLLYKKGDPMDPLNYRGIALTNSISKVFTAILSARLATWCERNKVLPESQGGFREGRSCEDSVFILQARICVE